MQPRLKTGKKLAQNKLLYFEQKCAREGFDAVIGIDEVGRGSLAGPVVACAILLKDTSFKNRIDDSKKLTPAQREKAFVEITGKADFSLGMVDERKVDEVNILVATTIAMQEALSSLLKRVPGSLKPCVLVDGRVPVRSSIPVINIIGGDARSKTIACASIVAKVTRDRIMGLYDPIFPEYGFIANKGYGTGRHLEAIRKFGLSKIHRRSFCESYA